MTALTEPGRAASLPDPWSFTPGGRHHLLDLAGGSGPESDRSLVAEVRALLLRHADDEVRKALRAAPDRAAYARLWRALCAATEGSGDDGESVATTVFALPLVMVSGARQAATVPGIVADAGALADVLARSGALGPSRNFGFGNALLSLETLERFSPSTLLAWRTPEAIAGARELAPEALAVRAGEEAHLRFLLGAAVTPSAAPPVSETASNIGAWGMGFARVLAGQLAAQGVDLLALPRPPAGIVRACYQGRRAQLDVALNLFLSNAIRRSRAATGDPTLIVSAHAAGDAGPQLRVSLSSAFDDALLEGFRWPLHPLDEPGEIAEGVLQFALDCRLTDVRLVETVLPGSGPGAGRFLRAAEAPPLKH